MHCTDRQTPSQEDHLEPSQTQYFMGRTFSGDLNQYCLSALVSCTSNTGSYTVKACWVQDELSHLLQALAREFKVSNQKGRAKCRHCKLMQIETETKVSANPCELLLISEILRALIVHFNTLAKVFAFAELIRTLTGSQTKNPKENQKPFISLDRTGRTSG